MRDKGLRREAGCDAEHGRIDDGLPGRMPRTRRIDPGSRKNGVGTFLYPFPVTSESAGSFYSQDNLDNPDNPHSFYEYIPRIGARPCASSPKPLILPFPVGYFAVPGPKHRHFPVRQARLDYNPKDTM